MAICGVCRRPLDDPERPYSRDCGGDCWECVSEIETESTGVDLEAYRRKPGGFFDALYSTEAAANPSARPKSPFWGMLRRLGIRLG